MSEAFVMLNEQTAAVGEQQMANAIRVLSMDAVQKANSGHPGLPMGMADVATVLFKNFLKFNPEHPNWPDRDRFVLSAGHGSMLLYSLLYLTGYPGTDIDQIKNFRQFGSLTAGHPEVDHTPGVETTTGPLGQGIANAVGMALAERMQNARLGDRLCSHYTYVIAGDGCLMEGISHEAISLAGHLKLGKLIVLFDDNEISIDGATSLSVSDDQLKRFEASGWDTIRIDGHDPEAIFLAIEAARNSDLPSLIACKTIIGYGAPGKQGTAATHGAPLGEDEIAQTRQALGWPYAPFDVPADILNEWRAAGGRSRPAYDSWQHEAQNLNDAERARLIDPIDKQICHQIEKAVGQIKAEFQQEHTSVATRVSSQQALEKLVPVVPSLVGGSADLTGSNGTRTAHHSPVRHDDFSGTYLHYGVREHAMAAAMNGIALHGGIVPYSGTFLVFADYCRPAIRLSALMKQRVIYVMTHDSIGLGEDGPTHQPVEHLSSLRSIPNLNVFRPADAVECAECWQIALTSPSTPSILSLTRQNVPLLRTKSTAGNLTANGAYILRNCQGPRQATIIATGSEVSLACTAAEHLENHGYQITVVSMPCWELFAQQPRKYREEVLGTAPRIAVEAGCDQGWHKWIKDEGTFIGMTGFGASAPADQLYEHFGITVEAIVAAATSCIENADQKEA